MTVQRARLQQLFGDALGGAPLGAGPLQRRAEFSAGGTPPRILPLSVFANTAVVQRCRTVAEASLWLRNHIDEINENPKRKARLASYLGDFEDSIKNLQQYPSAEGAQAWTHAAKDKLEQMCWKAQKLESIEARIRDKATREAAANAAGNIGAALELTKADSWHRKYASQDQALRMNVIFQSYDAETKARARYIAGLVAVADEVRDVDMKGLENKLVIPGYRDEVKVKFDQAGTDNPVACHPASLDQEVTTLRQGIEAVALTAVNEKFAELNTLLTGIAGPHTEGAGLAARLAELWQFFTAHDNSVVDKRDIDGKVAAARTLRQEAITFVNARIATITEQVGQAHAIIEHMDNDETGQRFTGRLSVLTAFLHDHDGTRLDTRDHAAQLTAAARLNSDAQEWVEQEFEEVAHEETATVAAFEAAAAPWVGRKKQFRSLVRQHLVSPGAVTRQYWCNQDEVGGYSYAFNITGAPNTVIHAHYRANDTLADAHFKPSGAPEGQLGHGINQLSEGQIQAFVATPKMTFENAHGVAQHRRQH